MLHERVQSIFGPPGGAAPRGVLHTGVQRRPADPGVWPLYDADREALVCEVRCARHTAHLTKRIE
ncbi:MAG: hypothetical protein ACRDT6_25890 [Micromonosporaceae bacterium]